MGRSAPCPDCGEPVSIIEAITVVRAGSVVLICPRCAREPADDAVVARSSRGPAPSSRRDQATVVEILAALPVAGVPFAPTALTTPTALTPPAETSARSIDVADITGEIALHQDQVGASTSKRSKRSSWSKRRRIAVPIAIASAALALTAIVSVRGQRVTPQRLTAAVERPPARALSRMRVAPPERPLFHGLSVSFSEAQAALPWVHPIASERELPDKDDRRFGAHRPGNRPPECLAGHCGVDLGGGRGATVHAALGGRVIRVKTDAGGASGRYVAIEHPQGLRSHYMHLERVHPNLTVGMEIASGEAIGTLGSTGVHNSPPHLHFTVKKRGGDGRWLYTDPEPMLEQATVLLVAAPLPDPPRFIGDVSHSSILNQGAARPGTAKSVKPTSANPTRSAAEAPPKRDPAKRAAPSEAPAPRRPPPAATIDSAWETPTE